MGESETVEFKGSRSNIEALSRAVCGMLNQQGGFLLWGVNDKGQPSGVIEAEQKAEELTCRLMANIKPRPLFSVSVQEATKGVYVIVVRIPPGFDKPYSFNRQIWVRIGSATIRAGEKHSANIVEEGALEFEPWERETMPGFGIEDCDINEMSKAREEIAAVGRFGADVPADNEILLERLALRRNGVLTNAAVVLFASRPRVWSPNIFIRIVSYASGKAGPIANDIILDGPAVHILHEAIGIIQQRTGFSSRFKKNQLEREDRPAYPLYALRESLVNAIAHRSYDAVGGSIRIEIYPDRLVVTNPGSLPKDWTIRKLTVEHQSIPFNPDITRVFYLRKLMEQLGIGTQKVIKECKQVGAKTPIWRVEGGMVSLTLFRAPEPEVEDALSGREAKFIQSLGQRTEFTVTDYVTAVKVSPRQGRRDLANLEERGIIERYGKGRATRYRRVRE